MTTTTAPVEALRDPMNTDDAPVQDVTAAMLVCARSWRPEARIIGNVRAGDIVRALTASPAQDEYEIDVLDARWERSRKISCTALAEWIAEQAIDDRSGFIQRVADALTLDRKGAAARAIRRIQNDLTTLLADKKRLEDRLEIDHVVKLAEGSGLMRVPHDGIDERDQTIRFLEEDKLRLQQETLSQQSEINRLREAVEPFAKEAENWSDQWPDSTSVSVHQKGAGCDQCGADPGCETHDLTVADLRRARAALPKAST